MDVGMELPEANDFSAELTLEEFRKRPKPIRTSPQLWADRQRLLSFGGINVCRCKPRELC